MITYSSTSLRDLLRFRGSVAPRAVRWALPCAGLAILYHHVLHKWTDWSLYFEVPNNSETTGWSMFTFILGFLVVFRAQLSYSRYWEGITLVEQACGVWMNGCSNLFAFCSTAPEKQAAVREFQHVLSRLASLLVCYSMCDISSSGRDRFPHLDVDCLEASSLAYLEATSAKQNVVLQWMQRLVVENARTGVIDIAPPILSRVFQEFSIGIVHFIDANKISTVPFPFVFAQAVWVMLVFSSLLPIPLLCAVGMSATKGACYTFLVVFAFWSVHYISVEIELPFGDDSNDLPLDQVNHRFNKVLQRLLDAKAQQTPKFVGFSAPQSHGPFKSSTFMCDSMNIQNKHSPFCTARVSDSIDSCPSVRESTARAAVREPSMVSDMSLRRTTSDPPPESPMARAHSRRLGQWSGHTTLEPCVEVRESQQAEQREGSEIWSQAGSAAEEAEDADTAAEPQDRVAAERALAAVRAPAATRHREMVAEGVAAPAVELPRPPGDFGPKVFAI